MVKLTFCLRVSFAMCLKHVCQRKRNDVLFLHVFSCARRVLSSVVNRDAVQSKGTHFGAHHSK